MSISFSSSLRIFARSDATGGSVRANEAYCSADRSPLPHRHLVAPFMAVCNNMYSVRLHVRGGVGKKMKSHVVLGLLLLD